MQVTYDRKTDILMIRLRDVRVRESDEVGPGVVADFDHDGNIVGFEIMDASRLVDDLHHVELTIRKVQNNRADSYGHKSFPGAAAAGIFQVKADGDALAPPPTD